MNITKHFNQINQIQVGYNIALSNLPSYSIKFSNQLGKKCCTVANLVANLGLNGIRNLTTILFRIDERAVLNYNYDNSTNYDEGTDSDEGTDDELKHVRHDLIEDNNNNVRHSGM